MSALGGLNLFDAIIILGVTLPTFYLATRIKLPPLKVLSVLLTAFLLVHGLYHLFSYLGDYLSSGVLGFIGRGVFEPMSYVLLFVFVVYFARRAG